MIDYKHFSDEQLPEIAVLLDQNHLEYSDLHNSKVVFEVASVGKCVVGCIGAELYGNDVFLRSFAVHHAHQKQGIGEALLSIFLKKYKTPQTTVHLLTTTAQGYFEKKNFRVANRNTAPAAIRNTAQFAGMCPASSVYMIL
ncbi:amino-acid N-acetyltransferase [Flexibacter flexilis DSM 6793]|uniref:Amino-acid N-acetyltransferase n=1 Tax=Flexibacter flexilis DSM 6793 TaxID=927664 RepID=A0A1I1FBB7_9BACT|nr:GNAT family N-acetyltransferase [Flexibacter flexilis]SFB96584.1 amino-acid N-acetyltransferase [Flexibacter flexilis DSM 6793]